MRILVLHTQVPFTRGGAEVLSEGLVAALRERGHDAEIVALPLQWNPPDKLIATALAWRMLDLTSFNGKVVDAVVCTKFPTWAVRHPNKVLWLVHQHRQAYDLYGTIHSEFGPTAEDQALRESVYEIDGRGIGECRRRFAISQNVANRLRSFNGIDAQPLYPPVEDRDLWPERYDSFILSATRLDALKRVDALIEAWPGVDPSLKLTITSDGPLRAELERRARELEIDDRVEFLGMVSDECLSELVRSCRAVYYAPIDEDYGYAAVEALTACKPVITAADSGGVLEFVTDGESGVVTSLDPEPLARAINSYADAEVARRHGEAGRRATDEIGWDAVIASLFGPEA